MNSAGNHSSGANNQPQLLSKKHLHVYANSAESGYSDILSADEGTSVCIAIWGGGMISILASSYNVKTSCCCDDLPGLVAMTCLGLLYGIAESRTCQKRGNGKYK